MNERKFSGNLPVCCIWDCQLIIIPNNYLHKKIDQSQFFHLCHANKDILEQNNKLPISYTTIHSGKMPVKATDIRIATDLWCFKPGY